MNTALTTGGRLHYPPSRPVIHPPRPSRLVGLIDKAARQIRVALISWVRKPRMDDSREQIILRAEQYRAQEARERGAEQSHRLMVPRL